MKVSHTYTSHYGENTENEFLWEGVVNIDKNLESHFIASYQDTSVSTGKITYTDKDGIQRELDKYTAITMNIDLETLHHEAEPHLPIVRVVIEDRKYKYPHKHIDIIICGGKLKPLMSCQIFNVWNIKEMSPYKWKQVGRVFKRRVLVDTGKKETKRDTIKHENQVLLWPTYESKADGFLGAIQGITAAGDLFFIEKGGVFNLQTYSESSQTGGTKRSDTYLFIATDEKPFIDQERKNGKLSRIIATTEGLKKEEVSFR